MPLGTLKLLYLVHVKQGHELDRRQRIVRVVWMLRVETMQTIIIKGLYLSIKPNYRFPGDERLKLVKSCCCAQEQVKREKPREMGELL